MWLVNEGAPVGQMAVAESNLVWYRLLNVVPFPLGGDWQAGPLQGIYSSWEQVRRLAG